MYTVKRKSKKSKSGFTWSVRFEYEDLYGCKQQYSKSGFSTKKEALDYGEKMKAELEKNGGISYQAELTFNDVFNEYMEIEGKYKYAPSTKMYYMNTFNNHIKNSIGQSKITMLRYKNIQQYFNRLDVKGKATNKNIKKVFCVTFKYAFKNGYIKENPMPMIEVRGVENHPIKTNIVTPEQLESLVDSLLETKQGRKPTFSSYSMCIFLYLGYYLGTRKSETLAISKEDIDFKNNMISINKRVEYHGLKSDELYLTETLKTKGSSAVIPICQPLKEILQEWFEYNPYDLACCCEDGNIMNPYDLDGVLDNHAKKLGFKFRSHDLRHSYITNLVKSGVDIKTVSELARHSDIRTTLQVYTHTSEADKKDAINRAFGGFFEVKCDKKVTNLENHVLN